MVAIKAHFDGERVLVPESIRGIPAGDVIVIFEDGMTEEPEAQMFAKAQETAFAKVWNNDEDASYDAFSICSPEGATVNSQG